MNRYNPKLYWEPKTGEGYYYLTFFEKENHILYGCYWAAPFFHGEPF